MKNKFLLIATFVMMAVAIITGCKKSDNLSIPSEQAHFLNQTGGSYLITSPGVVYKIPIGVTNVSSVDRVVNISVTSPTGAVQGTHYTLNKSSIVIPAGKAIDTLVVTGDFTKYTTGRKDTLIFTIQSTDKGGITGSDYNNVYKLFMRGPCSEVEINTDAAVFLNGSFRTLETARNANGSVAYANSGPYTTTSTLLSSTATTATIKVTNIYGVAAWAANFTLDWSNINDRKVNTTSQKLGSGAPLGLAAYDIYVEPPSLTQNLPANGDFTFCANTINLKFRLGAYLAGTTTFAGYITEGTGTATYIMNMVRQ